MHLHLTVFLFLTFAATAVFGGLTQSDIVEQVNSNPEATWTAGINFGNAKLEDLKLNGVLEQTPEATRLFESISTPFKPHDLNRIELPESFDSRQAWPKCKSIGLIRDQAGCASCWAFGAAEAISDRICIAYRQKMNPFISADDLTTCCHECAPNGGCEGGDPRLAWAYWVTDGIVTGGLYNTKSGCKSYAYAPYSMNCPTFDTPKCEKKCQKNYTKNSYEDDKHFGSQVYMVESDRWNMTERETHIMAEIFTRGPVEAGFDVYDDFASYTTGVYSHLTGEYQGGHAVKLLGWGVDKSNPKGDVKYWLAANSYGVTWGQEKGFFKILKGSNECNIESVVVAGLPAF